LLPSGYVNHDLLHWRRKARGIVLLGHALGLKFG
jgi:hypothetical protein